MYKAENNILPNSGGKRIMFFMIIFDHYKVLSYHFSGLYVRCLKILKLLGVLLDKGDFIFMIFDSFMRLLLIIGRENIKKNQRETFGLELRVENLIKHAISIAAF